MAEYRLVESNLRAAMRCYAHASEHGQVDELPGISVVSSGLPLAVFNSSCLSAETPDLSAFDQALARAQQYFVSRVLPWSFWLCEEMVAEADRTRSHTHLARLGLLRGSEPIGMHTPVLAPATRHLPALSLLRVHDHLTRSTFCEITSQVFHLPYPTSLQIYGNPRIWLEADAFLGLWNGRPVTTVMTVRNGSTLGFYSVATLESHRQMGCAEALLRGVTAELMREAPVHHLVLQATRQGLSLYRKLGFKAVARFAVYVSG